MWKKTKFYAAPFALSVLCWGWLFVGSCSAAAAEPAETVTMSAEQWEQLKQIISEQAELLETLETLSTADSESLAMLLNDLKTAKQSLRKVESELIAAKQSLKTAGETLAEQNKSLQILSAQIKKERQMNKRRQWQDVLWGIIAGIAISAVTH